MASLSPSDIGSQARFLLVEFMRERLQGIGMGTEIPIEPRREFLNIFSVFRTSASSIHFNLLVSQHRQF